MRTIIIVASLLLLVFVYLGSVENPDYVPQPETSVQLSPPAMP